MKIQEIAFQCYKSYGGVGKADQFQRLQLAPLTLVFGKNNSGKSAVVRLPRLLLAGLACDDERVLPLDVRGLRYGQTFLDLVHGGAFFNRPGFQVVAEYEGTVLDTTVTLYSPSALAADEPPLVWSYEMRSPEQFSLSEPRRGKESRPRFRGLLPPDARWSAWRKAAEDTLEQMVHLGPTRAPVEPVYPNESASHIGLHGAEAPQLLRVNGALADAVGDWYHEHMEGWRLSLKKDSESFSLRLGRGGALSTNLAQGGEGLQQVLPVVVHQLWRQMEDSGPFLDVIEQPELHLHDAAQAPVADLFIDTALTGRGQVVVETNSEPLLLRVQRRVAEGTLRPYQVAVYFVEMRDDGSHLRQVRLNDDGEAEWWPAGVFEEDFNEVAALRRAQRNRSTSGERA